MSERRKRFVTLGLGGEVAVLERNEGGFDEDPDYEWLCRAEDLGTAERIVVALELKARQDDGDEAAAVA